MDPAFHFPDPLTYPHEVCQHVYRLKGLPSDPRYVREVHLSSGANPDSPSYHVKSQTLVKRYTTFGCRGWKPMAITWQDNAGDHHYLALLEIRDEGLKGFLQGLAETYRAPHDHYYDHAVVHTTWGGRRITLVMHATTKLHTIVGWADYNEPHPPWTVHVNLPQTYEGR